MAQPARALLSGLKGKLRRAISPKQGYSAPEVALALYRGVLGRAPEPAGLNGLVQHLEGGAKLDKVVANLLSSSEAASRHLQAALPAHTLPDLRAQHPEFYRREQTEGGVDLLFRARSPADFDMLEQWIFQYRYYDAPGVWGGKIDLDKRTIAALALGLGGQRFLEIGCFTGAVLSVLKSRGADVTGVDASHLAFVLAYPNVRGDMRFGDPLNLEFEHKFDVLMAMDILEHFNPLKLDRYLAKLAGLLERDGYLLLNSPMFGTDDVFGTVFPQYVQAWKDAGDDNCWLDLDCDELGWPKHGHLVWASPRWWEHRCRAHGLVRDRDIERTIHARLGGFFAEHSSRKCLFVLKHESSRADSTQAIARIGTELAKVEGL